MRAGEVLRAAARASAANRARLVLTGLGITVGTTALVLILSLSLGIDAVVNGLVEGNEQIRHVVVMPGFGTALKAGSVPEVEGAMSEEKRARLRRTLFKRGFGGPPFQIPLRTIDAATEQTLAHLPEVESTRVFLQDRVRVEFVGPSSPPAREALSLGVPARHAHYPSRLLAGRWFTSDDEHGVVLHELLLAQAGFTSDEAQAALVGRRVRVTVRSGTSTASSASPPADGAAPGFTEELPIIGVLRERWGEDSSAFVDEIWGMQADVFLPQGLARTIWSARSGREGPRSMLLVAHSADDASKLEEKVAELGLQARSVREVFESFKRTLRVATIATGFLAGVAVFVAALGIVNTMVMSVLERTREIGILKALGATDRVVATLFLAEAALIGGAGGVLGVTLGLGLGRLGDVAGRRIIEYQSLLPFAERLFVCPWWLVVGSVAFAVSVALLAALVPALRASRIDPVAALRHE